ncbi:MAG: hypothetical protein QOH66_2495 [Actinomycetota bacterium]|jgi:hypothetical protein|nr:hypothetical protein [Actinomycetota bacterium]
MHDFRLECFQNEYLPRDGRDLHAVITITASRTGHDPPEGGVEVIAVDTSESMAGSKMLVARQATAAGVAAIKDGVWFAVIAGNDSARVVYPSGGGLAVASPETRRQARRAAEYLSASGGTAIGSWLRLITDLVREAPGIKHAILLTDGGDQSESPERLEKAIAEAQGVFQCDCRGVGTDWVVSELRKVSTALLGTVDIVANASGLAADFEAMIDRAMSKSFANVNLRVWTPQGAKIAFVKQVVPELLDLTERRVVVDPLSGDYPTGAWGEGESREYHICVTVKPGSVGDEMLAARVSAVVNGKVEGHALARAIWTDDPARWAQLNRQVAHYSGQSRLADVIAEGLEARKHGDMEAARVRLGWAVQLATQSGNADLANLLCKAVEVEDAATGKVRLKSEVDDADEMTLDTHSTKTVRVGR